MVNWFLSFPYERVFFLTSLTVYPLQYSNDLIERYQALKHLPDFVMLESSDKVRGRYDIVTALPYDEFKINRNSPSYYEEFCQFQRRLKTTPSSSAFPFQGGAIGYISYDLGALLLGVHSTPHPLLSDMPLLDMRFYDWAIIADHKTKTVDLVTPYQQKNTKDIVREVIACWQSKHRSSSFQLLTGFQPLITQTEYQQGFAMAHAAIKKGRAYQINFTQPFMGQFEGDAWEMYKRVRQNNPVPFGAYIQSNDFELLSFSPERFICIEHGHILASPIKGTVGRSLDPVQDEHYKQILMASEKDRAENVMIVDLFRNDLSKYAIPASVQVTALCEVMSFSAVHHLVSTIEAQCREGIVPLQVFEGCFPSGSITGTPKREAMHIIDEIERYSRGGYCGSIGYFSNHGRMDMNVAIRTVTALHGSLYMGTGGGIVMDSICENEYQECYIKIAAITKNCY